MTRVPPLTREATAAVEPVFAAVEAGMGFVPNSMFAMAHWPELLQSFAGFAGPVLNSGEVDLGLKQLVALVASRASGCFYCQAHTSHNAERRGVAEQKINAAFEFATSDLFDDSERAALDLALHAGMVPNGATEAHFEALRAHFSEREIVEIVAVISVFGFLNRWNDTMATQIEPDAAVFASRVVEGWEAGKHAG